MYVCTSVSEYTKITGRGRGGRARNGLLYFYFCIVQKRTKDKERERESKREATRRREAFHAVVGAGRVGLALLSYWRSPCLPTSTLYFITRSAVRTERE